jgi:RNA polymerase sigma-70 factor (ECF subfamily)
MNDNAIISLYFERDEAAIHETQKKYDGYLFTIASNILPQNQDAEECLNDTYLKTWETIPPNRPTFFQGFLAKITRNCSLDRYRKNAAKKRGGNQIELIFSELADVLPSPEDVHTSYENNITAQEITNFLRGLDKETRLIFMRRYFYSDSISAIANGCFISESKVKSSLFRTRAKLKSYLER